MEAALMACEHPVEALFRCTLLSSTPSRAIS
jgi:hypothetical protein